MGSYDYVHTGLRCGQVKCWGKGFAEITPGDGVVLHRQLDAGEFASMLGGSNLSEHFLAVSGHPVDDLRDYQVACGDGEFLVVRGGVFVAVATAEDSQLLVIGNDGRPFDPATPRCAHLGRPDGCEVCSSLP